MILRLAANTAIHGAAGVVMGVTMTLAACTVAQTAAYAAKRGMKAMPGGASPRFDPPGARQGSVGESLGG